MPIDFSAPPRISGGTLANPYFKDVPPAAVGDDGLALAWNNAANKFAYTAFEASGAAAAAVAVHVALADPHAQYELESANTAADVLAKLLTVDGSGSGLDADLLDGNSSAFYLPASSYTAADVLAKLVTVDGVGSGLDADLLDGLSSAAFAAAAHNHAGEDITSGTVADARIAASLSGKTLVTPTIASFVNAAHTHQNAAGGGQLDHGLALTGLGDDDHTQYHNDARGDARYQPLDADLTTLAGLASVANLTALAGLTGAADKVNYFTGAGAMAVADFTGVGRNIVGAATQALARTALGLGTMAVEAATDYVNVANAQTISGIKTFSADVILSDIKPPSDSTTAIEFWNAAKTLRSMAINTTNRHVEASNTLTVVENIRVGDTNIPSTDSLLAFEKTLSVPSVSRQGVRAILAHAASSNSSALIRAGQFQVNPEPPTGISYSGIQWIVDAAGTATGAGSISNFWAVTGSLDAQGTVTVAVADAVRGTISTNAAGATISIARRLHAVRSTSVGIIGENYGLYVDAMNQGATNYSIYTNAGDIRLMASATDKFGVYGATPVVRPAAFTQTYATADKTLGAYTPDSESGAYTGIDNAQGGTPYAQLTDTNALRVAYENLRAFVEDLAQFVNAHIDDEQLLGWAG